MKRSVRDFQNVIWGAEYTMWEGDWLVRSDKVIGGEKDVV